MQRMFSVQRTRSQGVRPRRGNSFFFLLVLLGLTALTPRQAVAQESVIVGSECKSIDRLVEQIYFGTGISDVSTPLVVVLINDYIVCSGVLVSKDTVLTAAHCLDDGPVLSIMTRVGGTEFAYGLSYRIHGSYIPLSENYPSYFDIAAIKLDHKISRSIRPAKVSTRSPGAGEQIFPFGYGIDENGDFGNLRVGVMTIRGGDGFNIYARRSLGESATCGGDSGGPAFVMKKNQLRLVGLTAFGSVSCTEDSGFTSVLHRSVKKFIKSAKRARR